MTTLIDHANHELRLVGIEPDIINDANLDLPTFTGMVYNCVIELIEVLASQRHSGGSVSEVVSLFNRLAMREILSPLTGKDDEWFLANTPPDELIWQNIRYSSVMKKSDNKAFDVDGIIFVDSDGFSYTNSETSVITVEFPYTPKKLYVSDVTSATGEDLT